MARLGYGRASHPDQRVDLQVEALKTAGCDIIRTEVASGSSRQGRPELDNLLQFIRAGDELCVTRVDRLARSIGDLQDILRHLRHVGATLRVIEQPIDTSTSAGKAFLDMLGVFAELETNIRRERQMEGIKAAKSRGVYKGRRATINVDAVRELRAAGVGPSEIARRLGIGRASVYRVMDV